MSSQISPGHSEVHDPRYSTREEKSTKILALLKNYLGGDFDGLTCLDVGCSNGGITIHMAPHFNQVFGMDYDGELIAQARDISMTSNLSYTIASAHNIPFEDSTFDVVICAQVYEHVSDQLTLSQEIWRITRPGGICFFSGPNRLKVMEEHYWLPFLSWLPRSLANLYLRVFRKVDDYDAFPLFYWQIRTLWKNFEIYDCIPELLRHPERYTLLKNPRYTNLTRRFPSWLIRVMAPVYPNYNWILRKTA